MAEKIISKQMLKLLEEYMDTYLNDKTTTPHLVAIPMIVGSLNFSLMQDALISSKSHYQTKWLVEYDQDAATYHFLAEKLMNFYHEVYCEYDYNEISYNKFIQTYNKPYENIKDIKGRIALGKELLEYWSMKNPLYFVRLDKALKILDNDISNFYAAYNEYVSVLNYYKTFADRSFRELEDMAEYLPLLKILRKIFSKYRLLFTSKFTTTQS